MTTRHRGNLDGSNAVDEPRDRSLDQAGGNGSFDDASDSGDAGEADGTASDAGDSGQDNGLASRPRRSVTPRTPPDGIRRRGPSRVVARRPAQVCALTANTARFGKSARGVGR